MCWVFWINFWLRFIAFHVHRPMTAFLLNQRPFRMCYRSTLSKCSAVIVQSYSLALESFISVIQLCPCFQQHQSSLVYFTFLLPLPPCLSLSHFFWSSSLCFLFFGLSCNFSSHYRSEKLSSEFTPFTGRSDYGPFIEVGIPGTELHSCMVMWS